jgi:precorrin-6A/cobalt-precorrin-6A reductase
MPRLLILGGTSEARELGECLAGRTDLAVTISLAGRTARPAAQAVAVRVGGFGGAAGLAAYLQAQRIDALIDATHPFAVRISAHAAEAAAAASIGMLALRRPPWQPVEGDRWLNVADRDAAVAATGTTPRRIFLALGRQDLAPFEQAPQHDYLVRSVDPVLPPLRVARATYVCARGPFGEADDRALLSAHRIDAVVTKNSGGAATYSKIAAARKLGLEVIMIARPAAPGVPTVETVAEAIAWLDHDQALTGAKDRGV